MIITCGAARHLSAQIMVVLDAKHARSSFKAAFYGVNGQQRNSLPWDQVATPAMGCPPPTSGFSQALQGLNLGVLRFPAGTGSNYWDWQTGDFDASSGMKTPSCYVSHLLELQRELQSASQPSGTQTHALFALNILTDPKCTTMCTLSSGSPNEGYQLNLLRKAATDQINIDYLELGNEFYLNNPDYKAVYPTAQDYATEANKWILDVRKLSGYSSVKIAAVGAHISDPSATDRKNSWNRNLMTTLQGADAVTIHVYPGTNLPPGTTSFDPSMAKTMLLVPFTTWESIVSNDLPSLVNLAKNYSPNVWVTEYNLKDTKVAAFGTWAHGLYTATLSLLFLENPRIQMAIHHEAQGPSAIYPDIFATACGFDPNACGKQTTTPCSGFVTSSWTYPPSGSCMTTAIDGLSATGLTQTEINRATLGQGFAEKLTFPNAPTFDGSHPQLYGWTFSGSPDNPPKPPQAVILNLSAQSETVDLATILAGSAATYRQLYATGPFFYVSGIVINNGNDYRAYDADGGKREVHVNSGKLSSSTTLRLPAYSITRVSIVVP